MNIFFNSVIHNEKKILLAIKIIVILLASIYLLGNFFPFYFGIDSFLYGTWGINVANGSYEYTNEFLLQTNHTEFIPGAFVKTTHNTIVPFGGPGLYGLSAISYFLGGYYALFYLGPISCILFLIISERII